MPSLSSRFNGGMLAFRNSECIALHSLTRDDVPTSSNGQLRSFTWGYGRKRLLGLNCAYYCYKHLEYYRRRFADSCPRLHLLKYVCRPSPVLPTGSTANPSAPVAVTCLPDVKVVKPTATTQPLPLSGELKQGPKPVPIPPPAVLPMSAVEKDLPAVPSDKLLAVDDGDEVRLGPNTIEITSLEKKRRRDRRMLRAVDDDEKSAALRSRSLALRNKKRG
uniref:Uncharacterized protein n=1 Tax=Ditylenchus dipsaci TaxID=166011 RepID=A0A915CV74_9BILA